MRRMEPETICNHTIQSCGSGGMLISHEHGARAGYYGWRGAMALYPENTSMKMHCAIDLFELLNAGSFDPVKGKEILSKLHREIDRNDLTEEADILYQLDQFKRWIEEH